MTKKYSKVKDEQRQLLIKLVYEQGWSIRQAAMAAQIYYATAKAINKIYKSEKRICKKTHRFRKIAPSCPKDHITKNFAEDQANKTNTSPETMLRPIREELSFGPEIYESLDEAMIDVTQDRIDEARFVSMPFDHFRERASLKAAPA